MQTYIRDFGNYILIQKNYSIRTVEAYNFDLNGFFHFLEMSTSIDHVSSIKEQDICNFLAYLSSPEDGKSPNSITTRARKLSTIRSYFSYLKKKKIIEQDPAENIDLPSLPEINPCYLTQQEYEKLIAAIKENATHFFLNRDLAIITLFVGTGIRVSELTHLRLNDVDMTNFTIKVKRKRNKEQTLPFSEVVATHLQNYLNERPQSQEPFVFVSKIRKGLRPNSVYSIVKKYLQKAGLEKEKQGPHVLRHTCFTMLMRKDVHPVVIQHLAGHSSFDTTRRYLHLNNKQVREAVNKLSL